MTSSKQRLSVLLIGSRLGRLDGRFVLEGGRMTVKRGFLPSQDDIVLGTENLAQLLIEVEGPQQPRQQSLQLAKSLLLGPTKINAFRDPATIEIRARASPWRVH